MGTSSGTVFQTQVTMYVSAQRWDHTQGVQGMTRRILERNDRFIMGHIAEKQFKWPVFSL